MWCLVSSCGQSDGSAPVIAGVVTAVSDRNVDVAVTGYKPGPLVRHIDFRHARRAVVCVPAEKSDRAECRSGHAGISSPELVDRAEQQRPSLPANGDDAVSSIAVGEVLPSP